jgi:hypothetical protein
VHDGDMAKWRCPCGNTIRSSGAIPNPQEWHLIADAEPILEQDPMTLDGLLGRSKFVYRCERCDRLHVFWDGLGADEWTTYAPEPR